MFVTMAISALLVSGLFGAVGATPSAGPRPTRGDIFASVRIDYKLVLNVLGGAIFGALFWLTARRGATDPVCGMTVDRRRARSSSHGGDTFFFCSEHCQQTFTRS